MTRQACLFVSPHVQGGIFMRVMAGEAAQGVFALLKAPALHYAVALKPLGFRYEARTCLHDVLLGAVTASAESVQLFGAVTAELIHL